MLKFSLGFFVGGLLALMIGLYNNIQWPVDLGRMFIFAAVMLTLINMSLSIGNEMSKRSLLYKH